MQNDGSFSPVQSFPRKRWVLPFLIIIAISIIGIIILSVVSAKTATINLSIAPIDAEIQLNGQGGYTNGAYQVRPGTYEITIFHSGFNSKSFTAELESGQVTTITTFLSDNGNFEFYKYKDNYASYQKLVEIASADNNQTTDQDTSAEQFISNFEQTLSITDILPIKSYVHADPNVGSSTAGFAIRDGMSQAECKMIACLLVNYYGKDYEKAVAETIVKAGYNPTDYQIIYERYQ